MSKILSQEEINALLKGKNGDDIEVGDEAGPDTDDFTTYDFGSPNHIILRSIPNLEIIYHRFARFFSTSFSSILGKIVEMTTKRVDVIKFGEFMRSLPVPTPIHIFKMEPLKGHSIFVLGPKLILNFVKTFFSEMGASDVKIEVCDFTSVEQQLIRMVVHLALKDLEQAWQSVYELSMVYQRTETNLQFVPILPPSDMVIVAKFEMEMENATGIVTVCIPYSTVETIRSKLYAGFQSDSLEEDHEWMRRLREQLKNATVEISVELGQVQVSIGELLKLKVGDVLALDQDVESGLTGRVEGVAKFLGRPGTHRDKKAYLIDSIFDVPRQ